MNCPGQAVNPLFNPSPLTLPEQQNTPSNILYEIKSNFPALIELYLKQIKTPGVPEQTGFFHCLLHYALVNVIRGIWKLPKPLVNVEPTQKISLHTPERVQTDIHHIVPKRKWNGSTGELVERLPAPLSDLYAESVEIYGQLLGPGNCLVNLILLPYNAHHQNVECIGANAAKYINPADHEWNLWHRYPFYGFQNSRWLSDRTPSTNCNSVAPCGLPMGEEGTMLSPDTHRTMT